MPVATNLLLPEQRELVPPDWETPTVPEVAVDEDDEPGRREDDVRLAGQTADVFSKPEPTLCNRLRTSRSRDVSLPLTRDMQ